MDTSAAKSLLLELQSRIQPTKAPYSKKFSERISELFICTLLTDKVVARSSFRGVCAYLFSSDERFFNQKDQVIQTFATAIKTVWNDKNERSLFKDHFFRDLRAEFKLMKQNVERTEYLQEFNQLNEIQQNKIRKKQEEIFSKSLFHATPVISSIFDFNQIRAYLFKDIFSYTEEAFINTKELFLQFLQARPTFAGHKDVLERNKLIDKALTSDSELANSMTKAFKALPQDKRYEKIKDKAKELTKEVQNLKVGEKWMCTGSFGVQVNSFEKLLLQLRKLPDAALSKLPPAVRNALDSNMALPDPKQFVDESIQPHIKKLFDNIPGMNLKCEGAVETFMNIFLYDENKKLPESISKHVPEMIRGELEVILQNGLFGCLIDCTEGPQRQLLEWICLNTDTLKDVNKRQDAINGLGKNIGNYFVDLVENPKGKIDRSIEHMVYQIQNLIPRDMLTLSGLDAHFNSGQLWLELERQNNGTFTVLVYGTGQALSYCKQNEKGEFTWPKRIEGVTYSKLNVDFFERFLFHRIEPNYDPEVISKAEHFFEGLLSYLEPDTVPINQKKINTTSQVDATINTPNAMAKQLLINPKHTLKQVQFEFRLQAFMDYCRPLFSPTYELKIPHDDVATIIQEALYQLENELRDQTQLDKEHIEQIKGTLSEVKEGLFAYHANKKKTENKDETADELLEPLKKMAYSLGLTQEYVKAVKETLLWILGPKCGPLLEVIEKILPKRGSMEAKEEVQREPGQWLQRSKLIHLITSTYFQAAFSAIRVMLSLLSIYRKSFSVIGMISGITHALDHYVPPEYLTWYHAVMSRTRHAIFQAIFKLILHCFVSKQSLDAVQKYLTPYLNPIETIGQLLNEQQPLSFEVDGSDVASTFPPQSLETHAPSFSIDEGTVHQTPESLIDFISLQDPPATAETLLDKLQEWTNILKTADSDIKGAFKLNYLLSRLLALETPSRNKQTMWDQVKDPLACMKALSNFYSLIRVIDPYKDAVKSFKKLDVIQHIVHYKLLAILHALTHRLLKDEMPISPLEVTSFLLWIKREEHVNVDLLTQLKEVVAYLRPDIDIAALPSEKALIEQKQEALFSYPTTFSSIKSDIYSFGNQTIRTGLNLKPGIQSALRTISDVGFKQWYYIDYSADPHWEVSIFNNEVLKPLRTKNHDKYVKKCLEHFVRLPINQEDLCLENFHILYPKHYFDEIYQHFMIVIEKGTYRPNTIEAPLFDLAILNMLILLHNLEWAQNDKNYKPGTFVKSHLAPPLHIPSDSIEKWLFDKDNRLELHPGLWLRFYHAYSFYLQPHGMIISDPENIIPSKYQEVYKKLHLTKKIDIRHKSKLVYRNRFKPQLLASPEFQYLQKRLEVSHVIDFFKAKKIEHIPNRSKLKVLFLESFYLDSTLFPEAWIILRQFALENSILSRKNLGTASALSYTPHYTPTSFDESKEKLRSNLKTLSMPLPPSTHKPSILFNMGNTKNDFAYHLLQQNNMSQQEIMDGSFQLILDANKESNKNIQLDDKLKTDLCLILCEPSDRINRILGYFCQNKYRLRIPQGQSKIQLTYFLLSLFEQCLLEIGQLEKQSQLSPDLFDAIGHFLSEACKDALYREKDPYLCLWLVRTSHILQGFCRKLNPKALVHFPNLLEYADQLSIFHSVHKAFPALHYLHAAFVLPDDPATLNPEEQKKATILLCKTLYTRLNVDCYSQQDLLNNLDLECHNRFGQWKEAILKHLEDEAFRTELILEIFKSQGKPLSPEHYQKWIQISPWKYQCRAITIDFLTGREETNLLEKIKDFPHVEYTMRGRQDELVQIDEGHWETPDGCFGIKCQQPVTLKKHAITEKNILPFVIDQLSALYGGTSHEYINPIVDNFINTKKSYTFSNNFDENSHTLNIVTDKSKMEFTLKADPTNENRFTVLKCIQTPIPPGPPLPQGFGPRTSYFMHYTFFTRIVPNQSSIHFLELTHLLFNQKDHPLISYRVIEPVGRKLQVKVQIMKENSEIGVITLTNIEYKSAPRQLSFFENKPFFNTFFISRVTLYEKDEVYHFTEKFSSASSQSDELAYRHYTILCSEPAEKKETNFTIYRKIEDKTFLYVPQSHVNAFFEQIEQHPPKEARYWVEETPPEASFKQVRAEWLQERVPETTTLKLKKANNGKEGQYQLYSWVVNGQDLIKVKLSEVQHHLQSLARFCPLDQIDAYINVDSKKLVLLNLKPYNLQFEVKEDNQSRPDRDGLATSQKATLRAYCQNAFEGHHIAENQFHPSLRGITSYLLLEPKKVLIPEGQWISSIAWRQLKRLGPFANLTNEYLRFLDHSFVTKVTESLGIENDSSKYHAYDMDADGNLTSPEPEAMAYLTMLYLMQGKREAAFKACERLEILARRMHFPHKIAQLLAPLALVPFEFEDLRTIRMRLFSALEENRLVHKTLKPEEKTWLSEGVSLLLGVSALIDLDYVIKNPDPMCKLRPEQEWFLYRSAFGMLRIFVESSLSALQGKSTPSERAINLLQKGEIESLIEAVGLNPHLSKRYREIKNKLQLKNGLISNIAHGVKTLYGTESSLPENFSLNRLMEEQSTKLAQTSSSKYTANNKTTDSSTYQQMLQLGRQLIGHLLLKDPRTLQIDVLLPGMHKITGDNEPHLAASEMYPEYLKKHFLNYYRIAKGEAPFNQAFNQIAARLSRSGNHSQTEDGAVIFNDLPEEYKEDIQDKQRRLKEMLPLLHGGWDAQSQALITYLRGVQAFPKLFPSVQTFVEAFEDKAAWQACWTNLWGRMLIWQSFSRGMPLAESVANKMGISRQLFKNTSNFLTMLKNIPLSVDTALDLGSRAINFTKKHLLETTPTQETVISRIPSYSEILQEDHQVNRELEKAFNLIYTVKRPPRSRKKRIICAFKGKQETIPILKERYKRVNESREAYYKRAKRVPRVLDFNNEAGVWEAYASIETFCESYKHSLNATKEDLLKHVNLNIREGTPFTWEQLEWAVLKNDFSALIEVCKLQQEEATVITRVLTMCMVKETRLLQMQRALSHLEKLNSLTLQADRELYKEKLENLADELQARRTYVDKKKPIPDRLLFVYLLIEKKTDRLIWKRQADFIARFIPKEITNAVGELLMSLGKTSTIIPTLSKFEADGEKPIFVIYPKTIAPTNIKSSSDQAKMMFDQIIHGLIFNRAITLSEEELQALSVIFRSTLSGEACAMTKEDAQSLELILLDRIFRCEQIPITHRSDEKRAIDALRLAIKIMRSGLAFQDEAHILYATDKEHNFPIGPRSRIQESYYRVVERAMHFLFDDPLFKEHLQGNNLLRISPETLKDKIAPKIAEKMIGYPPFNLQSLTKEEEQEFVEFVTGKSNYTPKWLESDEKAFPQVLMLRGLLTVLLKNAFQRVVNVNFGASKDKKNGEFPRPSDGNKNVDEEACIRAPYETLVKAFLMLGCQGLDQEQCLKLISFLKQRVYDISEKHRKAPEDIPLYRQFCNSVPSVDIFKASDFSQAELDKIVTHFGKNTDAIELYMRIYLYKTIPYWKENLCSNSVNFGSMFKFVRADTGTPYNDGTYPVGSKMIWDPGTTGEALHLMKQRCNGIDVLKKDAPSKVLKEILKTYFTNRKDFTTDFTAIIDGGALFKGLSNEEVAQKILAHANVHMPHIQAVVFFTKDADGNDQLSCLKKGAALAVPFDGSISPENYLSYFAQPNGFATDIKQKGDGIGIVLVGEQESDQTLQVFMQNGFRMRGLKVQKRVRVENEPPVKPQRVHFAMTKAAKDKITQKDKPTINEIFDYGIRNEAALAKHNNYESQLQKIPNVLRSALIDKIVNEPSIDKAIKIAWDFRKIFVSIIEDNPVKLFSFFEKSVTYKEGLNAAVTAVEKQFANSPHFSEREKNELRQKLDELANPPPETMPELVTVYERDGETRVDLYSDLGKQTQVREQSGEIDNEAEEEVENEQEQNQQNKQQYRKNSYSEKEWPIDFDIESNAWLRMTLIEDYYKESFLSTINRFVATLTDLYQLPFSIYYAYDLLNNAAQESLRKISDAFDKRLWCSNNFIPKLVSIFQDPVDPGGDQQKALFQTLIHYNDKLEITHMAPLTIKEAKYWRQALETSVKKPNVMVYDMELRIKVRGKEIPQMPKDLPKFEVMLHFLDGRVNYPKDLIPHLKEWLSKQNAPLMKNAFQAIHAERGKEPFEGSDIAVLFEELIKGT